MQIKIKDQFEREDALRQIKDMLADSSHEFFPPPNHKRNYSDDILINADGNLHEIIAVLNCQIQSFQRIEEERNKLLYKEGIYSENVINRYFIS